MQARTSLYALLARTGNLVLQRSSVLAHPAHQEGMPCTLACWSAQFAQQGNLRAQVHLHAQFVQQGNLRALVHLIAHPARQEDMATVLGCLSA